MTDREQQIILAAIEVFSRYGIKRTTMADIAAEMGISRQTLYASFTNKGDVIRAVIREYAAHKLAEVKAGWQGVSEPSGKIDVYFLKGVLPYFDKLREMPDFSDLVSGFNEAGRREKERADEQKREALETIFADHRLALEKRGTDPAAVADLLRTSAESFVFTARDRRHLEMLLASLKQALLSMIAD